MSGTLLLQLAAATPELGETAQAVYRVMMGVVSLGIVAIVACMLLCVARLLRGPHLADRVLAVDTLGVQLIGFVVLLIIHMGTTAFVDGVLVLSLLSFAGTVAMAQYIARPHLRRLEARNADANPDTQAPPTDSGGAP